VTASTLDIALDGGSHAVLLYERDVQLVRAVAAFLAEGVRGGETAVAIATDEHRDAIERELTALGLDAQGAALRWLDAAETLTRLMPAAEVEARAFDEVVGSAIDRAAITGRRLRVFGEMVSLLWEAGNVEAAIALEGRWNELVARERCVLLCAYRSDRASGQRRAALEPVCSLHSRVLCVPADGAAGVREETDAHAARSATAEFSAERAAAGAARRFVADTGRRFGCEGALLENAQLVVSELAANAIVHAASPFSVTVSRSRGGLRLSVRDESPLLPVVRRPEWQGDSGLGMRLLAKLSSAWGVERLDRGKAVWVDLGA
jgi:anti-sigma regulatory factor (Ser/Thr protein kinase)